MVHYRIAELSLVSTCFLPPSATSNPLLAILHIDNRLQRRLVVRAVDLEEKELSVDVSDILPSLTLHADASLLIPIDGTKAGNAGGVLVVGGAVAQFVPCRTSGAPPSPRASMSGSPTRSRKSLGKAKETDPSASGSTSPTTKKKRARGNSDLENANVETLRVADMLIYEPTTLVSILIRCCEHILT